MASRRIAPIMSAIMSSGTIEQQIRCCYDTIAAGINVEGMVEALYVLENQARRAGLRPYHYGSHTDTDHGETIYAAQTTRLRVNGYSCGRWPMNMTRSEDYISSQIQHPRPSQCHFPLKKEASIEPLNIGPHRSPGFSPPGQASTTPISLHRRLAAINNPPSLSLKSLGLTGPVYARLCFLHQYRHASLWDRGDLKNDSAVINAYRTQDITLPTTSDGNNKVLFVWNGDLKTDWVCFGDIDLVKEIRRWMLKEPGFEGNLWVEGQGVMKPAKVAVWPVLDMDGGQGRDQGQGDDESGDRSADMSGDNSGNESCDESGEKSGDGSADMSSGDESDDEDVDAMDD